MTSINTGGFSSFNFEIDMAGDKGELHFVLISILSIFTSSRKDAAQFVNVEGVFDTERENTISLRASSFRYFAPLAIQLLCSEDVPVLEDAETIEQAKYNCQLLYTIKQAANTGNSVVFGCEVNNYD